MYTFLLVRTYTVLHEAERQHMGPYITAIYHSTERQFQ